MITTATLAYTSDTATRQGWDRVDHTLLRVLRLFPATIGDLVEVTGYPEPIVEYAVLGYLRGGFAARTVQLMHRYELTLAGERRLAQLAGQDIVPAMRQAA